MFFKSQKTNGFNLENPEYYGKLENDLVLKPAERKGYTFLGWSTSNTATSSQYAGGATYTIGASNVTLYAVWSINQYTITFNGNGGSTPASITKDYKTIAKRPLNSKLNKSKLI